VFVAAGAAANGLSGNEFSRPGVCELRDQDERAWYRVIYLLKVRDAIHVLHCFEKRSREMALKEINTARQRLTMVWMRMTQEKKHRAQ
jgi:phage-related protein